jgi:hypothetical protein
MRNAKQCRDRYVLHLDPSLCKADWTKEEDALILQLYNHFGSKWSFFSKQLPGRSDNAIKNRFNGFIKKQLTNKKILYSSDTLCMQLKHNKEKKLAANNAKEEAEEPSLKQKRF